MTTYESENNPPPPDESSSLATASTFEQVVEDATSDFDEVDLVELFMKSNPPVFTGEDLDDLDEGIDWLSDLEKIFEMLQCDEDRKLCFATIMLKGRAKSWWWDNNTFFCPPLPKVEWKDFREWFKAKFYSQWYCGLKYREFLNLEQGDLSVLDYAKRFTKFSRFALSVVANEYLKAKQFEMGLRYNIRSAIEYLQLRTYRDVVETAMSVEREQSLSQCQQPDDQERKDGLGGSLCMDGPAKKLYVPTWGLPLPPYEISLSSSSAAKAITVSSTYRDSSLSPAYSPELNSLRSSSPSSTKVVAGASHGNERESDDNKDQKALEWFLEFNPPIFRGDGDPQEALDWLSAIADLFWLGEFDDRRKVRFSIFLLRGGANYWWTMKKEQLQAPVNWKGFCELFEADFYLKWYRNKKFAEFMNLKQGDLSVNDYEKQFTELSHFVIVANEHANAKKFEMGLRPDIRSVVELFRHRTYEDVVETARVVERIQSIRGSENEGEIW